MWLWQQTAHVSGSVVPSEERRWSGQNSSIWINNLIVNKKCQTENEAGSVVTSTPSQDGGVVWLLTTPHYSSLLLTRQLVSHCHHKLCDCNDNTLPVISISTLFCTSLASHSPSPGMLEDGGREADWCVVMRGPARLWQSHTQIGNKTSQSKHVPLSTDNRPTRSFPSLFTNCNARQKRFHHGKFRKMSLAL